MNSFNQTSNYKIAFLSKAENIFKLESQESQTCCESQILNRFYPKHESEKKTAAHFLALQGKGGIIQSPDHVAGFEFCKRRKL